MNVKLIKKLARINIRSLIPYQSARKIGGSGNIWVNANESPNQIQYNIKQNNLNRYPDCQPKKIIELYANYSGLKKNQILVHRGADEGIDLLIKTFCEPQKDKIMFFPPTYGMYKVTAESFGVKYYEILTNSNWQLNLSEIEKKIKYVKLIYVCNPNNPTANLINQEDLIDLIKITNSKAIIVIDEAYIEFCPKFSLVKLINSNLNLVILRTMSKAFSLAGIRCGFTLANEEIINLLLKVITPYPLPSTVTEIASQALSVQGIKKMKNNIKEIISARKWFITALKQCYCVEKIFNSNTNYVLIRFKNSEKVFSYLENEGIVSRNQNMQPNLQKCIRITIGTKQECKIIVSALKKFSKF